MPRNRPSAIAPALPEAITRMVTEAGSILLRYFGRVRQIRQKGNPSSVVCEADLAAEACVVKHLRKAFPSDGIIAEESGCQSPESDLTFVIDPLDGTSNFVAGLPWFGTQVGVLQQGRPVCAAMYLPVQDTLYVSQAGQGVLRDGKVLKLTPPTRLLNVLCAFGLDPVKDSTVRKRYADLLVRVSGAVRNIRATNSLFDFCYTLDGKLGACLNLGCKIWDIVPIMLMLPEAGGDFCDLLGNAIQLDMNPKSFGRNYQVLGAAPGLLKPMLRVIKGWDD